MALIGPRMRRFKGVLTTDGAGAASVALTIPSGGGAPATSYKLVRIELTTDDGSGTPLANLGVLKAQDNAGAGTIHATVTADGTGNKVSKTFDATAVVSTLNIIVSGGGAAKKAAYSVWVARTRAH